MQTRKIALACAVGAAICVFLSLCLAPLFWWVGLLAGACAGYLFYDLREVWRKVPVALSRAGGWCDHDGRVAAAAAQAWLLKMYPIWYVPLGIAFPLVVALFVATTSATELPLSDYLILVVDVGLLFAICTGLLFWMFWAVSKFPLRTEEVPLPRTCGEYVFGAILGVSVVVFFCVWTVPRYLAFAVVMGIILSSRFLWCLFKLIHSQERVLCAVDGTIAGGIVLIYVASFCSVPVPAKEQLLLAFFGGLIGAVIGVLDYQLVSRRLLKLVPAD